MNLLYTIMRGILYIPFRILFPAKVVGKKNVPKGKKYITVSNHLSFADIILVAIYIPGYRHIIAKKELANNPLIRVLGKWMGVIFVDRGAADLSAIRTTVNYLKKGHCVSIFPEGTRNKTGENMQEVKAGAAMFSIKGDAPLVPVMIRYRQKKFHRNYLCVGTPFMVDGGKKRLDAKRLEAAAHRIECEMQATRDYLIDYTDHKRWIEIKAAQRAQKQRFKQYHRNEKHARKGLKKALKEAGRA